MQKLLPPPVPQTVTASVDQSEVHASAFTLTTINYESRSTSHELLTILYVIRHLSAQSRMQQPLQWSPKGIVDPEGREVAEQGILSLLSLK